MVFQTNLLGSGLKIMKKTNNMKRTDNEEFKMLRAAKKFQRKVSEAMALESKKITGIFIPLKHRERNYTPKECSACKKEWMKCVCGLASGDPWNENEK